METSQFIDQLAAGEAAQAKDTEDTPVEA